MSTLIWIVVMSALVGHSNCLSFSAGMADSKCGTSPESHRVLTIGVRGSLGMKDPHIDLSRIYALNDKACLVLRVSNWGPESKSPAIVTYYRSCDRGSTWTETADPIGEYTNIPRRNSPELSRFAASGPSPTVYQFSPLGGCEHRVSTDGGQTWQVVVSRADDAKPIVRCWPVAISGKQGERIYSWITDKMGSGLWLSDDFGRTYRFFTSAVWYFVEDRANPKRMYGAGAGMLRRSDDGGQHWIDLESSRFVFRPVFWGMDGVLRTWDEDGRGREEGYPDRVEQILTDAEDEETFYVLTFNGLYRSTNGGRSFVLLPLEANKMLSIDRVAADPVEGRYLYAVVGMSSLYRSDDYGCSWQKLMIPNK